LAQDGALFADFRRHNAHWFPALRTLHRTTFVRQAANLWRLKERLWQLVLARVPHDPHFAIAGSFPLPVCQFARAYRCRRVRGEAAFGKDTLVRQTCYGQHVHVRLEWPGVILIRAGAQYASRVRYRIDTVFGQLVDRSTVRRVWARDLWHLSSRLLRKVLMHTLVILLNVELGHPCIWLRWWPEKPAHRVT
jgi:hypothetical protein